MLGKIWGKSKKKVVDGHWYVKYNDVVELLKLKGKGKQRYFVSDKPQEFQRQSRGFLGQNIYAIKI